MPDIEEIHHRAADRGDEVVRICKVPTYVEPTFGYLVTTDGVLVPDSMDPNWRFPKPSWSIGIPSPGDIDALVAAADVDVVRRPMVVSLRHWWEWNYYHFIVDVLGKLELTDRVGIPDDVPLVVGRYAAELPFARELRGRGELGAREWLVPDEANRTLVLADQVVYVRTRSPFDVRLRRVLDLIAAPPADPQGDERIFVVRRPPATRSVANEADLAEVLERHRFRTVDTATMSVQEQMELFASARYVVALHGAGVANVIFRRGAPLGLLELYGRPLSGLTNMRDICAAMGYDRLTLSGSPAGGARRHASFSIDPTRLEVSLRSLLA